MVTGRPPSTKPDRAPKGLAVLLQGCSPGDGEVPLPRVPFSSPSSVHCSSSWSLLPHSSTSCLFFLVHQLLQGKEDTVRTEKCQLLTTTPRDGLTLGAPPPQAGLGATCNLHQGKFSILASSPPFFPGLSLPLLTPCQVHLDLSDLQDNILRDLNFIS